ncbi:MAG: hypothetical protein PHE54_04190 [Bacilli bacterium]|nr:hypothetical protein [Bacilli bacterium]
MNVIISNKYRSLLQGLDIDIIKTMDGVFDVEEIISTFQNFYFQRMILDITAIKDYKDVKNLQKLSISLDMDKVILLLDDSEESSSPEYLSTLISMGIYNFAKNLDGIMYLYNNPNSYRDVAHIHQLNNFKEDDKDATPVMPVNSLRIIGVKNVTKQSGATTLVYMMMNQLSKNYDVIAIEVDKRDFSLFNDKKMISTTNSEIGNIIAKNSGKEVILVDVNDSTSALSLCHDVVYLIEPSIIKLNRLMMFDTKALSKVKDKKVILNQSMLNDRDVLDFEYESKIKTFFNMPPLDERSKEIHILDVLLTKLGFVRQKNDEISKKNKLLGLFNI